MHSISCQQRTWDPRLVSNSQSNTNDMTGHTAIGLDQEAIGLGQGGMAMEALPELRNSMVAVIATAEQPRALSACWEYGIAIPISPPHLPHCAPQTSCSIASAAADSCDRGDPDVRAVALAERLWWAKLLD